MPRILSPPRSLEGLDYFILRYHRSDTLDGMYELLLPGNADTYLIGNAFVARAYLERALGEHLGGRALDSATAFGASQCLIKERRAYGLDLTKLKLDPLVYAADKQLTVDRLLGEIDDRELVI